MQLIRRSLRLWVATWLVLQVASLSALVPRDCCAAHRPAANAAKRTCHQKAAATHCPMRAAGGAPCPMHRGGHSEAADTSRDNCTMRGTCSGPLTALFAQLSNHGVLPATLQVLPDVRQGAVTGGSEEHLLTRLASPDPPPPRA